MQCKQRNQNNNNGFCDCRKVYSQLQEDSKKWRKLIKNDDGIFFSFLWNEWISDIFFFCGKKCRKLRLENFSLIIFFFSCTSTKSLSPRRRRLFVSTMIFFFLLRTSNVETGCWDVEYNEEKSKFSRYTSSCAHHRHTSSNATYHIGNWQPYKAHH